jgi:hypothetical protein
VAGFGLDGQFLAVASASPPTASSPQLGVRRRVWS